jgi:(1->4)-alpha-D-glucan 1-alpha-D-glucosylmutase
LVSLNEVGGDPRRFGTSVAAFHRANGERLRRWPHAMTTTATHDTKRGEDTRLRIHVLSELAADWDRHARRWATWNRRFKRLVDERPAPAGDDEYLLYQTLVATWPATIQERPAAEAAWLAPYRERLETYAIKAAREAKRRSSWRLPNEAYEGALLGFLRALLDPARAAAFLDDLAAFAARVAPVAAVHGLAQLALKIAAPGIPDVYQGGELWDLALADPDNRRPVDWTPRLEALGALEKADASGPDARRTALAALLDAWPDGRVKLWVGARLLAARRREPALWRDGDYLALPVEGAADRIVAFARRTGEEWLVVAVPRLVAPLLAGSTGLRIPSRAWGDTRVLLPDDACPRARWRDELTGAAIDLDRALEPARAFDPLPLAVLRSV